MVYVIKIKRYYQQNFYQLYHLYMVLDHCIL